jgi:SAM-dependent methyltransferase
MSVERLESHREVWRHKPVLPLIYRVWFDALLASLGDARRVIEIGAGPGLLSEYAREHRKDLRWIATDILKVPWNDLVADGSALPVATASTDAVVAFDLIHHLANPAGFFAEAGRVLVPGGRLVVVEPWVSPLSFPVYRFLHEEGCTLGIDPWDPFGVATGGEKWAFTGDANVVRQLIVRTDPGRWSAFRLGAPKTRLLNGFAYLLSMGFQPRSLLPTSLAPLFLRLDRWTEPLGSLFAFRVLAEWRRA